MKSNKIQTISIGIISAALLIPFFVFSLYISPTADDFCNAQTTPTSSIINSISHLYFNWSGRYTHPLFGAISSFAVKNLSIYRIIPSIWILLCCYSFFKLLSSFIQLTKSQLLLVSGIISIVYLCNSPNLGEGIYWLTGARVYTLGAILFIFYLSNYINYYKQKYIINKQVQFGYNIILLILIIGCSESIALICVLFHLSILLFFKREKSDIIYSITSFVFITISFCAPGNFARSSLVPHYDKIYLLKEATLDTLLYFVSWTFTPSILFTALIFYFLSNKITLRLKQPTNKQWLVLAIIPFAIIASGTFTSYLGVGGISSGRTIIPSFHVFTIYIFSIAIILGNKQNRIIINRKPITYLVGIIIFILTISISKNSRMLMSDFFNSDIRNYALYSEKYLESLQHKSITPHPWCGKKPHVLKYHTIELDSSSCAYKLYD